MSKAHDTQLEDVEDASASNSDRIETVREKQNEVQLSDQVNEIHMLNWWSKFRFQYREYLAEFIATLVMVSFGDGVVAQKVLSKEGAGNYTTIVLAWGIGVTLGFISSGGVSGGHMNPAVTLSAAVFRNFPWRKVPGYIFSQLLGGFIAGFVVYGTYYSSIHEYEGGSARTVTGDTATAMIFCTYAVEYLPTRNQFVSEFVAATFLQFGIFSLTDTKNVATSVFWFPFGLFLLIVGLGSSFGYQTGYALNAARDFAPRMASAALGYGSEVWTYNHSYSWVPCIVPFLGCLFGGFLYDVFVFTGIESPVNQPYFGFGRLFGKHRRADVEKQIAANRF